MSFEETLIEVWRQAFVENAEAIVLGNERYSVVRTSKRKLHQINFLFEGKEMRGLEQNPDTKSRWAAMARDGKKVMQFLVEGRYVANVVDGKVTLYGGRTKGKLG
ncbi:MAG: hypothetical protein ACHQ1H_02950 [Nitrososphaerales archaeon]